MAINKDEVMSDEDNSDYEPEVKDKASEESAGEESSREAQENVDTEGMDNDDDEEEEEDEEDDESEFGYVDEEEDPGKNVAWQQLVDLECALMQAESEGAPAAKEDDSEDDYEDGLYIHEGGEVSDADDSDVEARADDEDEEEELPHAPRMFVVNPVDKETDVIGLRFYYTALDLLGEGAKERVPRPVCIADFRSFFFDVHGQAEHEIETQQEQEVEVEIEADA